MTCTFIYNFVEDMQKIKDFQEQEEAPILVPVDNLHQKKYEKQMHTLKETYGRVVVDDH